MRHATVYRLDLVITSAALMLAGNNTTVAQLAVLRSVKYS